MFHLGGRTGRPDPRWDGGSEKTGSQTDVRRTRTALSELEPQTETGKQSCQHRKVDVRTKNIWIKTDVTYHSSEITNSLLQQQKCVVKWWKWVYSFLSIHKLVEYVDVDMKLETWLQFFASIPPELWCSAGFWPVLNTFLALSSDTSRLTILPSFIFIWTMTVWVTFITSRSYFLSDSRDNKKTLILSHIESINNAKVLELSLEERYSCSYLMLLRNRFGNKLPVLWS